MLVELELPEDLELLEDFELELRDGDERVALELPRERLGDDRERRPLDELPREPETEGDRPTWRLGRDGEVRGTMTGRGEDDEDLPRESDRGWLGALVEGRWMVLGTVRVVGARALPLIVPEPVDGRCERVAPGDVERVQLGRLEAPVVGTLGRVKVP